jgi:hypothetical protein
MVPMTESGVSNITMTGTTPGRPPEMALTYAFAALYTRYEETHTGRETSHYGRQRTRLP